MKMDVFIIAPLIVLATMILLKIFKEISKKYNYLVDIPNQRSSHSKEVPRGGGIVIVLIVLLTFIATFGIKENTILGFMLGGISISLVGFIDDLFDLKGMWKIIGMVFSSVIPLFFGLQLNYVEGLANGSILLMLLSVVWIYGMINSFNFMDGIDGLIPGTSAIFSFFLIGLSLLSGNYQVAAISLLLFCSCVGFLAFNYYPASIFLGDIGSMFLGYCFAVLSLILVNSSANQQPIYVFVLLFAVLIYDSMVTFIRRGIEGKNLIEAHREHLYQRLIILGYSHRDVSLLYFGLSILFGIFSILFLRSAPSIRFIYLILALAIMYSFSLIVKMIEKKADNNE
ncbi:hypothetical protein HZC34_08070 [Candidatus Saganbacteria bacterium]|nr:hypothetical protein [Candidatus Saganbacteria bacterium]